MGGTCSTHGRVKNVYTVLVGKSERIGPGGEPGHRWQHFFKQVLEIRLIGW
jgi:hypothetical protein